MMSQYLPEPTPSTDPSTSDQTQPGPSFVITLPDAPDSHHDWYLWAGVLALLTMVCFWPAISGNFLWDDDHYITRNLTLLDLNGLRHIWFKPIQTVQYYPLTYTTFWIEHHFWENAPLGYHVDSLLLHALSAVVLWRLLRRLSMPGAWLAAAIWAIHPLQAESVCWISERKNVLCGLLGLCSFLFYLDFAGLRDPDSRQPVWKLPQLWQIYLISLVLFIAAMLSKTVVCCVPVALMLVLWWKRRLDKETFLGLVPMFIIGAALSAVTGYFETNPNGFIRATGPEWDLSPVQRVLLASRAVWFYLAKLFLPIHLSFNYPRIVPDPSNAAQCCYFVATVVVLVYLFVARGRLGRGPLVAAVCYLAALFPAMGFVNTYPFRVSFVWDHFQYLAGIPLIAAVICGIAPFFARQRRFGSRAPGVALALPVGLAACLLLVTTVASRARAYVFVDNGQLWQDTLAKNPHSWFAAYNLAGIRITSAGDSIDEAARLSQGGDQDSSQASAADAVAQLNQAQQLLEDVIANSSAPPDLIYQSYTQLAVVEITRRRLPGADVTALMRTAEEYLQNAIADEQKIHVSDRDPLPYYDMGLVKMNQAQFLEQQPQAGAATQPAIPPTTRPATPAEQRVLDLYAQAQDYFLRALEAAKNSLYAINNWGQARQLFEISARQRGNIDWHLAALAHQRGDRTKSASYTSEALADYQGSFFMNPDNIETNYQLALCLEWFGHFDEAQWHLRRIVIKLNPYFAPAYNEIGLMLLQNPHPTMDDLQTAIQCFKDALNLDKNLTDAASNLQKATALLASARPVTRPSTAPAATRP